MAIKRTNVQPSAKKALIQASTRRPPSGGASKPNYGEWYQRYDIFPQRVADLKWTGTSLQNKVGGMLKQYFSFKGVQNLYPSFPGVSACVCLGKAVVAAESTWNPNAGPTLGINGELHYGLWQLSSIHSSMAQWPTQVGLPFNTIYNPEYNTRIALTMMNSKINDGQNPFAADWEATYDTAKTACGVS